MKVTIKSVCEKTTSSPSNPPKIATRKPTHSKDLKILTPKQMFERLIRNKRYFSKLTK